MTKFRYLIYDPYYGGIRGTNSEKLMNDYAVCDDYYVVDLETFENVFDGDRSDVVEVKEDIDE